MAFDHSITYKKKNLRNILHQGRLKKILKILDNQNMNSCYSYLDIGCSNGYLTSLITQKYGFLISKGVDHENENLNIARNRYNDIKFNYIDLNKPVGNTLENYDVITCFETLEHVGNMDNAIQQILAFAKSDSSFILISVPIEIYHWGIVKFIIKMIYGYSLKELKNGTTFLSYFKDLITFKNIAKYRDNRDGWGTHFGFDYREVDKLLLKYNCDYTTKNHLSTRFYLIHNKSNFM